MGFLHWSRYNCVIYNALLFLTAYYGVIRPRLHHRQFTALFMKKIHFVLYLLTYLPGIVWKLIKIKLKSISSYKFKKHTKIVQYKQKWFTRKNTISTQEIFVLQYRFVIHHDGTHEITSSLCTQASEVIKVFQHSWITGFCTWLWDQKSRRKFEVT